MRELVFAGFGGQGVLTAGLIISQIALYKGVNATWMPAYGAAQRGGTANCTVHYGAEKITNPGQQKPDLVLAMNTPSFKKFVSMVRPGGTILVNADMMTEDTNVRDDINVVSVHCNQLADKAGNPKGANIVMIGAITRIVCITPARTAEGGAPVMNTKNQTSRIPAIDDIGRAPKSSWIIPTKNATCMPETATMCIKPAPRMRA